MHISTGLLGALAISGARAQQATSNANDSIANSFKPQNPTLSPSEVATECAHQKSLDDMICEQDFSQCGRFTNDYGDCMLQHMDCIRDAHVNHRMCLAGFAGMGGPGFAKPTRRPTSSPRTSSPTSSPEPSTAPTLSTQPSNSLAPSHAPTLPAKQAESIYCSESATTECQTLCDAFAEICDTRDQLCENLTDIKCQQFANTCDDARRDYQDCLWKAFSDDDYSNRGPHSGWTTPNSLDAAGRRVLYGVGVLTGIILFSGLCAAILIPSRSSDTEQPQETNGEQENADHLPQQNIDWDNLKPVLAPTKRNSDCPICLHTLKGDAQTVRIATIEPVETNGDVKNPTTNETYSKYGFHAMCLKSYISHVNATNNRNQQQSLDVSPRPYEDPTNRIPFMLKDLRLDNPGSPVIKDDADKSSEFSPKPVEIELAPIQGPNENMTV